VDRCLRPFDPRFGLSAPICQSPPPQEISRIPSATAIFPARFSRRFAIYYWGGRVLGRDAPDAGSGAQVPLNLSAHGFRKSENDMDLQLPPPKQFANLTAVCRFPARQDHPRSETDKLRAAAAGGSPLNNGKIITTNKLRITTYISVANRL